MKGSIRQRSKGSWEICIDCGRGPATDKRLRHFETVKGTKKDAQRRLAELLVSIEKGSYIRQPKELTVAVWLQRWVDTHAQSNLSPKTVESYEQELRCHVIPSLGGIRLNELRPHHIQEFIVKALSEGRRDGTGGLSRRTVQYDYTILSKGLDDAIKMGLIAINPCKAVTRPRPEHRNIPSLCADDLSRLIAAIQESTYRLFFLMLLFAGLRRGESQALRWCDCDADLTLLHVTRSLCRLKGGAYLFKEPKSARGRRPVDLPPFLAELLRRHRVEMEAEGVLLRKPLSDTDLVFCTPAGEPLSASTLGHAFARVVTKAGRGHLRLHDLRHLNASMLLQAGIHPKVVSERLGHSSVAFTLDVYSHVMPAIQKAAAQRLEETLDSRVVEMLVSPNMAGENVGKMSAKKPNKRRKAQDLNVWGRGDSNPHAQRHMILSHVRLPLPTLPMHVHQP